MVKLFGRLGLTLAIFVLLLVVWKWAVISAVARPALIDAGIVSVAEVPVPSPGFSYPRLGIVSPVTELSETSPLERRDWRDIAQALRQGVSVAYAGDSFASASLAFLTGHSSDVVQHPYAAVFAGLGQAEIGDEFLVLLDGTQYQYKVRERMELDPWNTAAFEALAPAEGQRVALVTCWPPLTTARRLVVVGERQ